MHEPTVTADAVVVGGLADRRGRGVGHGGLAGLGVLDLERRPVDGGDGPRGARAGCSGWSSTRRRSVRGAPWTRWSTPPTSPRRRRRRCRPPPTAPRAASCRMRAGARGCRGRGRRGDGGLRCVVHGCFLALTPVRYAGLRGRGCTVTERVGRSALTRCAGRRWAGAWRPGWPGRRRRRCRWRWRRRWRRRGHRRDGDRVGDEVRAAPRRRSARGRRRAARRPCPSTEASTRNWRRMTRGVAPSALRSPISRIRSVTDTSMMFMTPMPPTSSEIPATPPSRTVSVLSTDVAVDERPAARW